MIDFSVEPEFQAKLDWMNTFVREECETMDLLWPEQGIQFDKSCKSALKHLKPLQAQVRAQGLWACHLGPNLGGPGYGQVKLALMNEIIGRSNWAPVVFGTAPAYSLVALRAKATNGSSTAKSGSPRMLGSRASSS
jgi:acyl-CoA dehydrogenase